MAHLELQDEINHRMRADHIFEQLKAFGNLSESDEKPLPRDFDCLKFLMTYVEKKCGRFNDYSLKYVRNLVNICELTPHSVDGFLHRIDSVCMN